MDGFYFSILDGFIDKWACNGTIHHPSHSTGQYDKFKRKLLECIRKVGLLLQCYTSFKNY